MSQIERLDPASYRRIPWKNGRGELVVIDREGSESWQNMGVAWHFGRTAIVEAGPFSDYSGYERLQAVIKGEGLVLEAPDHEIDLRQPMRPQRYDGGIPVRTRLEHGPVEVVNLIADRARFDIALHAAKAGSDVICAPGRHVIYVPRGPATVAIDGVVYELADDNALRLRTTTATMVRVKDGHALVGSILDKAAR